MVRCQDPLNQCWDGFRPPKRPRQPTLNLASRGASPEEPPRHASLLRSKLQVKVKAFGICLCFHLHLRQPTTQLLSFWSFYSELPCWQAHCLCFAIFFILPCKHWLRVFHLDGAILLCPGGLISVNIFVHSSYLLSITSLSSS